MNLEEKILKLKEIENKVKECKKCYLYKTRKFPVPGDGNPNAKILMIGEAPGYWEDKNGKPFVGAAGKFLDELLELSGLKRREVFITNVIKCRPPKNREPTKEEIKACSAYLERQIQIIKPKIIITLGNVATSFILNKFNFKTENIGKIHGKSFKVNNLFFKAKIIPMYHPASALHNPNMKDVLREDWRKIALAEEKSNF